MHQPQRPHRYRAVTRAIWPCGPPGQLDWPGGPQGQYRIRELRAGGANVAAVAAPQWMRVLPGICRDADLLLAQSVPPIGVDYAIGGSANGVGGGRGRESRRARSP